MKRDRRRVKAVRMTKKPVSWKGRKSSKTVIQQDCKEEGIHAGHDTWKGQVRSYCCSQQ